jgi:hypothetical protein
VRYSRVGGTEVKPRRAACSRCVPTMTPVDQQVRWLVPPVSICQAARRPGGQAAEFTRRGFYGGVRGLCRPCRPRFWHESRCVTFSRQSILRAMTPCSPTKSSYRNFQWTNAVTSLEHGTPDQLRARSRRSVPCSYNHLPSPHSPPPSPQSTIRQVTVTGDKLT